MPTVFIALLDLFSGRNFLFTPLWDQMVAASDIDFVLLSHSRAHAETIAAQGIPHIHWEPLIGTGKEPILRQLRRHPSPRLFPELARRAAGWVNRSLQPEIEARLIYRFNHMNGFRTHRLKRHLPLEERYKMSGELKYLGWPLPGNQAIYNGLYRLLSSPTWRDGEVIGSLFHRYHPDLVVIAYPQKLDGFQINRAARRAGIPVVAYINSWDQPTTKGPLPPNLAHAIVWNQQMADEIVKYHSIPAEQVSAVGAAHMDLYLQEGLLLPRDEFIHSLGLDPARRLIVYGTYAKRLGMDEPEVARHLAEHVAADAYSEPASLLIRPHPHDLEWQERFGVLDGLANVRVKMSSNFGFYQQQNTADADLRMLINLMNHADIVINGPGTLTLDAIAFDTPVVNVGFDGDRPLPYERSILFRYDFDHYAPIIQAHGSRLVKSYDELEEAVNAYLDDPALDADGRERIRRVMLAPFDGQAARRTMDIIRRYL